MGGSKRWLRLVLCAIVSALLYLPALGHPALWEPDEGRYAEIAREMKVSGDYVTPRNDWVRYFEKPPLQYWLTAGTMKLLGVNEFAVRLPAALSSVGQVVVTEALGETMFGAEAGMLGALALALSPLFVGFARFATPDPALAFFITAALGSFFMATLSEDFGRGAGRVWFILTAALLALGTLVKGPVALVLGGGVALLYILAQRRGREIARIPWVACVSVYALIVVPWFVLAALRNPGFLWFFFVHEHVLRYLESTEHSWGPYFFVVVVTGGLWPWLYFVPLGIGGLWRAGDSEAGKQRLSALCFLLVWFAFVFAFFSIPRSKLGSYILPGIPPLAIIAGYGLWLLGRVGRNRARRILGGFVALHAILFVAAVVTFSRLGGRLPHALIVDAVLVALFLLLGAVASPLAAGHGRRQRGAAAAIAIGVLAAIGFMAKAREDAAPLGSYRELARAVTPYLGPGCVLASYRHYVQSLPFYTARREVLVDYRGELAPFGDSPDARESFIDTDAALEKIWSSKACVVLIANRTDLLRLKDFLMPRPTVIAHEGKKLALYRGPFRNRAASGGAVDGDLRAIPQSIRFR